MALGIMVVEMLTMLVVSDGTVRDSTIPFRRRERNCLAMVQKCAPLVILVITVEMYSQCCSPHLGKGVLVIGLAEVHWMEWYHDEVRACPQGEVHEGEEGQDIDHVIPAVTVETIVFNSKMI